MRRRHVDTRQDHACDTSGDNPGSSGIVTDNAGDVREEPYKVSDTYLYALGLVFVLIGIGAAQYIDPLDAKYLGLFLMWAGVCVLTGTLCVSADRFLFDVSPMEEGVSKDTDDRSEPADTSQRVAVSPGRAKLLTMEVRFTEEKPDDEPKQEANVEGQAPHRL